MTKQLYQLPDGARFVLLRTGETFTLLRRERKNTIVLRDCKKNESFLHHACHVKRLPSEE